MKTAISIPDTIFEEAEQLAQIMKVSRSTLYVAAIVEFIKKHNSDEITRALNEIYKKEPSSVDPFILAAQSKLITDEDW